MATILKHILALLEERYPAAWAAPDDRVGLMVGDPEAQVSSILVALEASPAVLDEAREQGAGLLLTHHPLLYRPLAAVRQDEPLGRLIAAALRAGVAVAACHTNLDVAPGGLNDFLATRLGLEHVEVFAESRREPAYKLTVFVPVGYEDQVRAALMDHRVGVIGRYSHCSFAARGQGAYRPLAGAAPFQGQVGSLSRAEESRLEVLVPERALDGAIKRLRTAHPYEEAALDVYPLARGGTVLGYGRVGDLPREESCSIVLERLKEVFGVSHLRMWGRPPAHVRRLAVLGGSGGDFINAARRRGAQLFVTGEVRHHQVSPGDLHDFAVVEVGHFASEALFMPAWAQQLEHLFSHHGFPLAVSSAAREAPPLFFV
jgi:dinuclear metal center YbgI/SA1388 family protein